MNITRHISIDDESVEKIRPYLEKHNGNLGAAIRDVINQAGSLCTNSSSLNLSLFSWMFKEVEDKLVPDDIIDELIDPALINSMEKLEGYTNRRFCELGWGVGITLKYDNDMSPAEVLIEITGSPQKIKFIACLLSQYLVKNSLDHAPLEVRTVINFNECIKVELSASGKKEAQRSLFTFFGGMEGIIQAVKSRPSFWKGLIRTHLLNNYNMVTVHRNYLEDLLADKVPMGEITIETLARRPIQEIPLPDMLSMIKQVYETCRVFDRVDIDNDALILFHNFRSREAVDKIKKSIVMLLETNGHLYDAKTTTNMIVLTHRPDVGIKINEIVDNLKASSNRVDQELIMFMTFLQGLKDMPDIPLSLTALGKRIGRSLMQEYEWENGIMEWDLENFQKALQRIDSKLHRESEWKLDGKNLLYTIRKCNIVNEGNTFDTYVCHTARETFKGALNYAFGNKAELNIKRLLTHGDNFCEVDIRIP